MPWLLMAVVLAAMGTPRIASASSPTSVGSVVAVSGTVTVMRPSGTPQPLKLGDALYRDDVIEARKNAFAQLWLGSRITVTVRELSRLELREEVVAEGVRYTLNLLWGKLRASVGRMLMSSNVNVQTRNAVASVRGTDFIVESLEWMAPAHDSEAVGNLGRPANDEYAELEETFVTALSGVVVVSNRLSSTGKVELIRPSETFLVRGTQDPVRIQAGPEDARAIREAATLTRGGREP